MNKSESIKELAVALAKFQGEVNNPQNSTTVKVKSDKGSYSYKYAKLDEVLNIVRPILSKNGLSIVQVPTTIDNQISVSTMLLHSSGEWLELEPITLKMDKSTAQGAGGAITYARRYSLSAALGIASEDDDDTNGIEPAGETTITPTDAPTTKPLSDAQIKRLFAIAHTANIEPDKVKAQVKAKLNKEVEDLTKAEYDAVCKGYQNIKK